MNKQHSINEIRSTLKHLENDELIQLCLRMSKYKKENKELLSYLLYESKDESTFIADTMAEMDQLIEELKFIGSYKLMKQIRKIGRTIGKPIKYSGLATTQIELLIHYCKLLKPILKSKPNLVALHHLYAQQIKKIEKAMEKIHEDIQYDYKRDFDFVRS